MNLDNQNVTCHLFFQSCMEIFRIRGREYAPEDVPMLDVLTTAVQESVSILAVLRILTQKHITAVRHLELRGDTLGPPALERFRDIANFQALQAAYVTHQTEYHTAWTMYWTAQPCAPAVTDCQRCQTMQWLTEHRPSTKVFPPVFGLSG